MCNRFYCNYCKTICFVVYYFKAVIGYCEIFHLQHFPNVYIDVNKFLDFLGNPQSIFRNR